jgi:putative membrane protein
MRTRRAQRVPASRRVAAGAVAGVAASWVMSRFMESMMEATPPEKKAELERAQPKEEPKAAVAQAVAAPVLGRRLTSKEKETAAPVVHYVFGAFVGAVYAVVGAAAPVVRWSYGMAYGTAVWLLADEVALPSLGLMRPPEEQPGAQHAGALAAHLVYGAALWAGVAALESVLAPL